MGYCRECRREIIWLYIKEKYVPVDPSPAFVIQGEGMDRFYDEERGEMISGREATPEEVQTKEQRLNTPLAFVPHWRKCPQRGEF
ncbi:MAG: hypothetical protein HFF08_10555 [Oscillospiraceae bacterium]|nr:hypothetical protein [Oscillospiraceae bacterium]